MALVYIKEYRIVNGGYESITDDLLSSTPSQAVLTLKQSGKDRRKALRVMNGNVTSIAVQIAAGDGPRSSMKEQYVTVGAGDTAYIPLFDTARFMNMSTGEITVTLKTDATETGTELGAPALAEVLLEAVQL